ncbi:MAG: CARDB domain-containing protein [candidate division WOR-3 bacterium]|nr:CARDB domain-containing protein [candidate division WOR-3 bacterium]
MVFRIDVVGGGNAFIVIDTVELSAGQILDYTFSQGWNPIRGNYIVSCSTRLTTDMNNANNRVDSLLYVISHDLMTLEILEPAGRILPGTVVNPRARIRNNGTEKERNFQVMFRIGNAYLSYLTIDSLLPGRDTTIRFLPSWTAVVGSYVVSCSTMLVNDINLNNNKVDTVVKVLAHDVGVLSIITPRDSVAESTIVYPRAIVKNYGNSTESFYVRFKIGNFYNNVVTVFSLEPDSERIITFPSWTAVRGNYLVSCSTELAYDDNNSNDKQERNILVYAYDIGVTQILEPRGYLYEGNIILPKAKVKNFGNRPVSCSIYFAIGDTLRRAYLSSLLPDSERIITFSPGWRASRGFYIVKCSTALLNDMYRHNDVMIDSVKVLPATRMAIYFQDFNSIWNTINPPPGWRVYFTGDTSENDWHRKLAGQTPWTQNLTPYPAIFYRYTSDSPDSLISPIINCQAFRNILLKVNMNFRKRGSNYQAKIVGRDNLFDAWYLIKEYTENFGPAIDTFRLPWADGKSEVQIAFVFEGNLEDIYYWCFDDFGLYGDTIYNYDAALLQAISPKNFELPQPIPVSCKIANIGLQNIPACTTIVSIKDTFGNIVYSDMRITPINRGETLTINFNDWIADTGHYQVKFFTKIGEDNNPFNDTIIYSCYVNWEKLYYYDDGVVYRDTAFYLFDQGMGVRYIPEMYPATLKEVHLYLNVDTITYANRFRIRIVKDNGRDSSPGTLLYESPEIAGFTGWNSFQLPIKLTIDSGGFYIFYLQTDDMDNTPKLARDRARSISALHRYYFVDDGDSLLYKKDTTNGDWMIRVVIDYRHYLSPPFPDWRVNFVYKPRGELSLRPKGIRYKPMAVIQNVSNWIVTNASISCTIYDSLMNVVYNSYRTVPLLRPQEVLFDTFLTYWHPQRGGKYYVKFRTHVPGDNNFYNDTATKIIYIAPPLYTGGPDHGIYRHFWIDSDTITGPRFNWIDTTNAFRLITEGDNAVVGINLPFNFKFYDTTYNYLWIGVDGFAAFGRRPEGTGNNTRIPYHLSPNNAIFAYWDDLICGRDFGGGSISYKVIGERPERKVVIIYQNMRRKGTDYQSPKAGITFEIILQENGNVIVQYLDVNCGDRRFNYGRSASVGIEDSTGNIGLEYLYGEGKIAHNYPGNRLTDSLVISFYRYFKDCGITKLIKPRKGSFIGEIRPNYLVKNLGTLRADTLKGYAKIFDKNNTLIYFDSVITNLNVGDSINLIFSPINLSYGRYTIVCSLWTREDIYSQNDTLTLRFEVNKWIELAPIPRGRYNRRVKWGALVYVPSEKRVYALKGANTNEFWYYDVEKDTWDTMPSLPDSSVYTRKKRRAKYGCALTYSLVDNKIYATKGGNSQEFYAFDLISRRWVELCTIPKLSPALRVYGFNKGTALVYEPTTQMVYATKGGNTNEFWAYNPLTNRWTRKAEIPRVPSLKTCGIGTAMTAGGGKIYLVKGKNTYDFYSYNPLTDSWKELRSVTYKPTGKRVTKGAAITYFNNKVYLVKGGNSQDFVSYDVFGDSWTVKDTVPRGRYNRKIKSGAAMTCSDDGIIYLFKGGNVNEFWAYTTQFDTIFALNSPILNKSIMEEEIKKLEDGFGVKIYPNPATKVLYFRVNKASDIKEIKIYNSIGSVIKDIKINKEGVYYWNFKKEKIPKGIYIIKIKGKEEKKIKVILM